jgi:hypothetical protein
VAEQFGTLAHHPKLWGSALTEFADDGRKHEFVADSGGEMDQGPGPAMLEESTACPRGLSNFFVQPVHCALI